MARHDSKEKGKGSGAAKLLVGLIVVFVAFCAAILFKVVTVTGMFAPAYEATVLRVLFFAVSINLVLAVFNLIPIHPLDGSKVAFGLLPKGLRALYGRHVPYGMFIILVLLLTKKISMFVFWPINFFLELWMDMGLLG